MKHCTGGSVDRKMMLCDNPALNLFFFYKGCFFYIYIVIVLPLAYAVLV